MGVFGRKREREGERERWFGKLKPMSSTEMLMKMAARLRNVSQ